MTTALFVDRHPEVAGRSAVTRVFDALWRPSPAWAKPKRLRFGEGRKDAAEAPIEIGHSPIPKRVAP
jgi:hypothetical protein